MHNTCQGAGQWGTTSPRYGKVPGNMYLEQENGSVPTLAAILHKPIDIRKRMGLILATYKHTASLDEH